MQDYYTPEEERRPQRNTVYSSKQAQEEKKSAVYNIIIAVLVLLIVIAAVVIFFIFKGNSSHKKPTQTTPSISVTSQEPYDYDEDEDEELENEYYDEDTDESTDEDSDESESTDEESTSEATEPSTEPTIHYVSGTSGSFTDDNDYKVKLIVEYGSVKNDSGEDQLNIRVYLQSYSLQLGSRTGSVTVNGKKTDFTSEAINIEEAATTKTLLTEMTVDSAEKQFNVDVSWNMKGSYAGEDIDTLEASGIITLE